MTREPVPVLSLATCIARPLTRTDAPEDEILQWVTATSPTVSIFNSIVDLHSFDGNLAEIFTGRRPSGSTEIVGTTSQSPIALVPPVRR